MSLTPAQKDRFKIRIAYSIAKAPNGCWLWIKSRSRNGYGRFATGGGGNARAHRISYEVFFGEIPPCADVCHKCDVRACVNPDHLFLGSRSENILDASRKNRVSRTHQKKGSEHPSSKLTEDDVGEILDLLHERKSKVSIGRLYGVSDRVVLLISRGTAWKHVPRRNAVSTIRKDL